MLPITKNTHKTIFVALLTLVSILTYKNISDYYKSKSLKQSLLNENVKNKKEINHLLAKYDSLNSSHNTLQAAIVFSNNDSFNIDKATKLKLDEVLKYNKESEKVIKELNADLKKYKSLYKKAISKKLSRIKLEAVDIKGVKIITRSGTESYTTKLQQLRICLSLTNLNGFTEGLFVQIINPKKEIFTATNQTLETRNSKIIYTRKLNMHSIFDNDLCEYISLDQNKAIKGNYTINIYDGIEKIHTSNFNY